MSYSLSATAPRPTYADLDSPRVQSSALGSRSLVRLSQEPGITRPEFGPQDEVGLALEARQEAGRWTPYVAALLRLGRHGRLVRVPTHIVRSEDAVGTRFELRARAQDLFAPYTGTQQFFGALAVDDARLGVFEGSTDGSTTAPGVALVSVEMAYRQPDLQPALLGHRYITERAGVREACFVRGRKVQLRMQAGLASDWSAHLIRGQEERQLMLSRAIARGGWVVLEVSVPQDAPTGRCTLEARAEGVPVARWDLRVVDAPEDRPELSDIVLYRKARRLDSAASLAEQRLEVVSSDEARLWLLVERGKVAYRQGRMEVAVEAWSTAVDLAESLGVPTEASARLRTTGFLAIRSGRYAEAVELISRARAIDSRLRDEAALALDDYYEGLIYERSGGPASFARAYELYGRARDFAWRSGDDAMLARRTSTQAMLLSAQGHHNEALRLLRANPPPEGADNDRAFYLSNLAWVRTRAMEVGYLPFDAELLLDERREALELLVEFGAPDHVVDERVRLARVLLTAGRLQEAQAEVEALALESEDSYVWVRDLLPKLRAELELRSGHPAAAELRLRARLREEPLDEASVRGLLGQALVAQERLQEGVDEFERALESSLSHRTAPRSARAAGRRYLEKRLLLRRAAEAMLAAGKPERAWLWSERLLEATSRELAGLGRSDGEWFEPGRDITALLRADEVYVAALRLTATTWVSWRVTRSGVSWSHADPVEAWFSEPLENVGHVYVSPGGHDGLFDLPVQAMPSLQRRSGGHVSTSILPHLSLLSLPEPTGTGSLIVADTQGDLPVAREVARRLDVAGPSILLIGDEARSQAVLEAWRKRTFVFLGHGENEAGDPFSSGLRLADGSLRASEVLSRAHAFDLVVLAGCSTGRHDALFEGAGLVHSLLATGTSRILASTGPVPDDDPFSAAFLQQLGLGATEAFRHGLAASGSRAYRMYGRR